jgi:hypothetical protein
VSQATYARLESGERVMRGEELVVFADLFGVRAATITGAVSVSEQARFAARTDGTTSPMVAVMREKLYAYLELDSYLAGQGMAPDPLGGPGPGAGSRQPRVGRVVLNG